MKVILLKEVKKVGKKDQVIEVSDGYANNFLFPRKLALPYTQTNISQLEASKAKAIANEKAIKEKALEDKAFLDKQELVYILSIGANGKAFGSITAKKIEEDIKAKFNINVDRKKFINFSALTHLGVSTLQVELYKDVIAHITTIVKDK